MAQTHHTLKTLALVLGTAAMLCGCPAPARRPEPASQPPSAPTPSAASAASPSSTSPLPGSAQPRPPPRQNSLSPATRSLVAQSRALLAHGDFNGASSTLDRALRIEPNNPLLWIELGRVRLVESDARQAEGCGRKALALASGDHGAQQQAGRLLADALRAQQRNQEAREVESQPFMN
jgi:tetratricopeptide (TPR) repeat protein